jgi:hypothetical protein
MKFGRLMFVGVSLTAASCVDNVGYEQGRIVLDGFLNIQAPECLANPQDIVFATGGAIDTGITTEYIVAAKVTNTIPNNINPIPSPSYPNYGPRQELSRVQLTNAIIEITGTTTDVDQSVGGNVLVCDFGVCGIDAGAEGVAGDSDGNGVPELLTPAAGTVQGNLGTFFTLLPGAVGVDIREAYNDAGFAGVTLQIRARLEGENEIGQRVRSTPNTFSLFSLPPSDLSDCARPNFGEACFAGQDAIARCED